MHATISQLGVPEQRVHWIAATSSKTLTVKDLSELVMNGTVSSDFVISSLVANGNAMNVNDQRCPLPQLLLQQFALIIPCTLSTPRPCSRRRQMAGRLACALSHIRVQQLFLTSSFRFALILEDDVDDIGGLAAQLKAYDALTASREAWDLLYLGFCYEYCSTQQTRYHWAGSALLRQAVFPRCFHAYVDEHVPLEHFSEATHKSNVKVLNIACAHHRYAVSRGGSRSFLNATLPIKSAVDDMVASAIFKEQIRAFTLMPPVANQRRAVYGSVIGDREELKTFNPSGRYTPSQRQISSMGGANASWGANGSSPAQDPVHAYMYSCSIRTLGCNNWDKLRGLSSGWAVDIRGPRNETQVEEMGCIRKPTVVMSPKDRERGRAAHAMRLCCTRMKHMCPSGETPIPKTYAKTSAACVCACPSDISDSAKRPNVTRHSRMQSLQTASNMRRQQHMQSVAERALIRSKQLRMERQRDLGYASKQLRMERQRDLDYLRTDLRTESHTAMAHRCAQSQGRRGPRSGQASSAPTVIYNLSSGQETGAKC